MVSRKKQLKRLKKNAQQLWADQQDILNRANGVARDALPHAQYLAKEKVVPGAKTLYDDRLKSTVDKGALAGKAAGGFVGSTARDAVVGTVVPAVTSAAAAALTLAEEASNRIQGSAGTLAQKSKAASKPLDAMTKKGQRTGAKANVKTKGAVKAGKAAAKVAAAKAAKSTGRDKGLGAGGVIGIILGVLALAGIGYAVWQTLRADDDLWVADDEPETTPNADGPTTA